MFAGFVRFAFRAGWLSFEMKRRCRIMVISVVTLNATPDVTPDVTPKEQQTMSEAKLPDWMQQHLDQYLKTNGAEGHLRDFSAGGGKLDTPNLLLTTTGRKSGKKIMLPLIYGTDGTNSLIVASKGGAPEHPAWYLNLQAQPQVAVQAGAKKFNAIARTATGAERQRLWQVMAEVFPPYNEYQTRTTREIPVVVLEPIAT